MDKLKGDKEQGIFKATTRLLHAYCAGPGVSPNRKLDYLAEDDDDMKLVKVLIRQYEKGIADILKAYDNYFALNDKPDFWTFFNNQLEPKNLQKRTKSNFVGRQNVVGSWGILFE